jgi:hypothetical protein
MAENQPATDHYAGELLGARSKDEAFDPADLQVT